MTWMKAKMITDAAQSVTAVAPARFSAYDHIQTCRVTRIDGNATGGSGATQGLNRRSRQPTPYFVDTFQKAGPFGLRSFSFEDAMS